MKTNKFIQYIACGLLTMGVVSCNDFLDREPLSTVSPEGYFVNETQLQSYLNNLYTPILPSHNSQWDYGIFGKDVDTDNQVGLTANDMFTDNLYKVPHNETSNWDFELIYRCNYFLQSVLQKYGADINGSENTIVGDLNNIKHYIGEAYFLRASEYFKRYMMFGDFPIVTEPLTEDLKTLIDANKRSPRNEVARFILSDLDMAYTLLSAKKMATTRINADVALLLKSRVALFEGTWLKYFKGTPFVPNGEGWPGKSKDYNSGYEYPSGNIDNEINYFLEQCMDASKKVAETYKAKLTQNTLKLQQSVDEQPNPYYEMFATEDLSSVDEVLLWRQYARDIVTHNVNACASRGNYGIGVTRGLVNNFLMLDGTPVYAHGSYADGDGYYMGDKTVHDVKLNRDTRLSLFLKEPGEKNILIENVEGTQAVMVAPYPLITASDNTSYRTGYCLRKGGSFDQKYYGNGEGYTGAICYRATEALLNYIEASYEKNKVLDNYAEEYWNILRKRAGITGSIQTTVNSTDISKDAENDWGAYSAGKLLDNPVLYSIRRERRSEFMAEGLRYMDLCRWRAMDQLITKPYIVEGFHLWNTPMQGWYKESELISDGSKKATVSSPELSEYLRPYQKTDTQVCYDGLTWRMAHYLKPIMIKQFMTTAPDGTSVSESPLYQNPYWPVVADMTAEK